MVDTRLIKLKCLANQNSGTYIKYYFNLTGWLKFVVISGVKCSSVNAHALKFKTFKTLDLPSDFHYYYGERVIEKMF